MRTTVEIEDALLHRLRDLAVKRGERGFSRIVNEALKDYFTTEGIETAEERRRKLRELFGAWDDETADAVRRRIEESRTQWR
jgi:predicted transcriptional regulator